MNTLLSMDPLNVFPDRTVRGKSPRHVRQLELVDLADREEGHLVDHHEPLRHLVVRKTRPTVHPERLSIHGGPRDSLDEGEPDLLVERIGDTDDRRKRDALVALQDHLDLTRVRRAGTWG